MHIKKIKKESSINFPEIQNYLKQKIGNGNNNFDNISFNDNKQLWLFHAPPNFDLNKMHQLKIKFPKKSNIGQIVMLYIVILYH